MIDERIKITKLDAAKRQLDCAIELYFAHSDQVSIHTLSSASFEILQVLAKNKFGKCGTTQADILETAKRLGMKNKIHALIHKPKNFFKHGHSDVSEELEFRVESTLFVLYEACQLYQKLSNTSPIMHQVLQGWVLCRYPIIIKDRPAAFLVAKTYSGLDRVQFKEEFVLMKSLIKAG